MSKVVIVIIFLVSIICSFFNRVIAATSSDLIGQFARIERQRFNDLGLTFAREDRSPVVVADPTDYLGKYTHEAMKVLQDRGLGRKNVCTVAVHYLLTLIRD